ncbi:MAG TPA: hypothetical protein VLT84_11155 [Acidobacteriota bacterium]|nr:hypothetical protein [Acidobacteriota bacterium]
MEPSSLPAPDAATHPPTRAPEAPAARGAAEPTGGFTTLDGETYYRIAGYHRLRPFLMTVASDSDLWMFVTSGGGLTAGRRDPDGAIFPSETVDRLHDGHHHTGPITLVRVEDPDGSAFVWQPFAHDAADDPLIERSLYKNVVGNRLVFEEAHVGLGLRFRYRWSASDEFGWVRTATLENRGAGARTVALLDGLRNVLPHGAPLALYQHSSCLVDAYKRSDGDPATRLAIYSLTAMITDRAEAAEELRATTVWCHGLEGARIALSPEAVAAFRRGDPVPEETTITGRRGHYLASASLDLAPGARATWHLAADAGRSHVEVAALRVRLLEGEDLGASIERSLDEARESLIRNVASADGLQLTEHAEATAHHFANVLFNNMRGGVFAMNHDVPVADLVVFLRTRNRRAAERHEARLRSLPGAIAAPELLRAVQEWGDEDLTRLCREYLPLCFGRRHGDPSRPWNRFSVRLKNPDGSRALHYEGNWRDIFQNWEALCHGFPDFIPSVVATFVNASTVDGFNPYRITRDGLEWEVPDPRTPWGQIGYWGDHQIVYLLRFLEAMPRVSPGTLEGLLGRDLFGYAEVPYRLKPYDQIVEDPRHSIDYDAGLASRIEARVASIGADGRLLQNADGSIRHVNLLEKLLVPALSKISNYVPGGGIWMNTQRPEWNDANNALAGHGLSMVTLFHLRRYLRFLERLLGGAERAPVPIGAEIAAWLHRLHAILVQHRPRPGAGAWSPRDRKRMLDELGRAFSDYRAGVYAHGFQGAREEIPLAELVAFCGEAIAHLDHAIRGNRREDGLYHSYNVLEFSRDRREAFVHPLDEMLEGQVAALASGVVEPPEALGLLARLFESRLYRADQKSFMLYPEKELPSFLDRNRVPEGLALEIPLLRDLLDAGDGSILARDALGVCRFQGDLRHALDLGSALDRLALLERWTDAVARDRRPVLDLFEHVFRHRAFTGRSGTMYAYEGLGSVYWHMVAKLLLAVQEMAVGAECDRWPASVREALADAYDRIRGGLGFEKSVKEYGAFPTDPYSHTPAHAGAQQPGMTGQVKELILTRFGELGVAVEEGRVSFRPALLRRSEFLTRGAAFRAPEPGGGHRAIDLPAGSLAFTFCQVPVIYRSTRGAASIRVFRRGETTSARSGLVLDLETSRALLSRSGAVARIEVEVPESSLRPG